MKNITGRLNSNPTDREALHREALDALGLLSKYHEAHGEYEQALQFVYKQLELEAWREEAHRQPEEILDAPRDDDMTERLALQIALRDALRARHSVDVGVIVSDTFGRPWRTGLTDVAIGVCGIGAVLDLRGQPDALGQELHVTEIALADEIASAAELVMGKAAGVPVAIVRGLDQSWFRESSVRELLRPTNEDLFR